MSIHIRTCAACGLKFLHATAIDADRELAAHWARFHNWSAKTDSSPALRDLNDGMADRPGTRKWWEKLRESEDGGFSGRLTVYDKIFLEGAKIGI